MKATNEEFKNIEQHNLSLREAEVTQAQQVNAINVEKTTFRIHVENEFLRVSTNYSFILHDAIDVYYARTLKSGKMPDLEGIIRSLKKVVPPAVTKFIPTLLTKEQMIEIYSGIKKPDYEKIFDEYTTFILPNTFANFESD